MRNETAEWVISRVAGPEQARTIVGDLLEAQPGPIEFWVAVVRATASIARHQPRRALSNLLWFASEAAVYLLWVWLVKSRLVHTLGLGYLFISVPLFVFSGVWLVLVILFRKAGTSSSLMCVAFNVWLLWHNALLEGLWVIPPLFALCLWWRRSRPPKSSPPIAG